MRRRRALARVVGWASLLAGSALAAAEPAPATVTLDELMRIALQESPLLRARDAEHRAALERVPSAGALADPEVTWEFRDAPLENPAPSEARENNFSLSQRFPFPGKRGLAREVAAADADVVNASLDDARITVANQLRNTFYHLHHLYQSIAILEQSNAALSTLSQIATQRYAVGTSPQQDALKADVELASQEARLTALREEVPAVESRIQAIVGRDLPTPLGRPEVPDSIAAPAPVDSLIAQALARAPSVRAADAKVVREKSGVGLARKEGLPELMLEAGYMIMKDMPDAWMGEVGMTLPVWRGGKVGPMRREAEAGLVAAEAERDQIRRDEATRVREAYAALAAARARVTSLAGRAVPRAQQAFESTRFAYENGRAGFLDLLDAQRTLLSLRLDYEEAFLDALMADANLTAAVGEVPEVAHE